MLLLLSFLWGRHIKARRRRSAESQVTRACHRRPPHHTASHAKTMNPSSYPSGDRASSVLFAESYPLPQRKTFDQTEMATTVGATLTSTKLVVMQGDLHLVGSYINQLVVQFDRMAFDEFLAADQIKAS